MEVISSSHKNSLFIKTKKKPYTCNPSPYSTLWKPRALGCPFIFGPVHGLQGKEGPPTWNSMV
uniref:Uncharacterized protein n=1 Tax=Rhizophora mucronata TaxID=61149 RepID=A0A2P2P114_RHIMU